MKLSKIRALAREHAFRAIDPAEIAKRKRKAARRRRLAKAQWLPGDFWNWYNRYLESAKWKAFRLSVFAKRGAFCEDCRGTKRLQLHHLTYRRVGREKPEDVKILCKTCHEKQHDREPKKKESAA